MTGLALRPLRDEDWPAVAALDGQAFGTTATPEHLAVERAALEVDRMLGAYDAELLVGHAAAYSLQMTVPGGLRPVAGVTWVCVLPTHRRRGVLSALMRAQLHGLHETGGEAVAALHASEPAIYGRFGYGPASRNLRVTVPRSPTALVPDAPADPDLRLRLVDVDASLPAARAIEEAALLRRPGMILRSPALWAVRLLDLPDERGGQSALRCVLVTDSHGPRGIAYYAVEPRWDTGSPAGVVTVREAIALDPAATATLWRYLLDLDLTATVVASRRPVDDPLLDLLADVRRAAPVLTDALFVRLVDVDRALASRTYALPVDVVLDVRDELCPWNAGCWRLRGGPEGATCERTSAPPDLTLPVTELGAAYLGGTSLVRRAAAGFVTELRAGALDAASRAFSHDPAPWCPQTF